MWTSFHPVPWLTAAAHTFDLLYLPTCCHSLCAPAQRFIIDTSWGFIPVMHHNRHHLSLIGPLSHTPSHLPLPLPPLTATLHTFNYLISQCLHRHNFSPSLLLFYSYYYYYLEFFVALSTPRTVSVVFNIASLVNF